MSASGLEPAKAHSSIGTLDCASTFDPPCNNVVTGGGAVRRADGFAGSRIPCNDNRVNQPPSPKQRLLVLVASLGPLGYLPASGTATVLIAGVPMVYLMHRWSTVTQIAFTVGFMLLAVWIHDVGDRILGEKDSRKLVWDELAGFFVACAMLPSLTWTILAIAFVVERAIDIAKIPPANWIEKRWPGGWGVVGDDIVAGLYTRLILYFVILYIPSVTA